MKAKCFFSLFFLIHGSCSGYYLTGTLPLLESAETTTTPTDQKRLLHYRCTKVDLVGPFSGYEAEPPLNELLGKLAEGKGDLFLISVSSSIEKMKGGRHICVDLRYSPDAGVFRLKKKDQRNRIPTGEPISSETCKSPMLFITDEKQDSYDRALTGLVQKLPEGADGYMNVKLSRNLTQYTFPLLVFAFGKRCQVVTGVPFRYVQ